MNSMLTNYNTAQTMNTAPQGNIFTDIADAFGIGTQRRAQEYNSAEAEAQRRWEEQMANNAYAWQENMSNTAYQRAVADMTKAGLNPALMYGSGGAASTPAGAIPSGASANSAGGNAGSMVQGLTTLINAHNTSRMLDLKTKNNKLQTILKMFVK